MYIRNPKALTQRGGGHVRFKGRPPPPDQSDHRGKKRNLKAGGSDVLERPYAVGGGGVPPLPTPLLPSSPSNV